MRRCLKQHEAQETWEVQLMAFLVPAGDLQWAFCLSYLTSVMFPSFWLGYALPVLVLVGCCCLAVAACAAQRALGDHKGITQRVLAVL